jgi:hypothetical protein
MEIDRDQIIAVMRRVGMHDDIPRALSTLPDPVDSDRDSVLLASLGLSRGRLMEMLGSSP